MNACKLILPAFLLCMAAAVVNAQDKEGCITAKCHPDRQGLKYTHAPMPQCETCHELTDKQNHKFKLTQEEKDLCGMCHPDIDKDKAFKHSPVSGGSCTVCHDPHGSSQEHLVRESDISKICFGCHEDKYGSRQYKHGPLQSNDCTSCHKPHGSAGPKLLDLTGKDLCFVCHADKQEAFSKGKTVHMAAKNNCTVCHDPHSASFRYYLKKQSNRLCLGCHLKAGYINGEWKTEYGKGSGYNCVDCHLPHNSENRRLLKKEQPGPCPVLK